MSRAADALVSSPPAPHLGEVLEFMRVMWALEHALQKAPKRMARNMGVTGPQRLVIRIVARFPGITAGQIAEFLHVHPSTLTGILKRLQRQGLAQRRSDPRDLRRAFLGITEKGKAVGAAGGLSVEMAVERVMSRTPRARLDAARQVLMELETALMMQDYGGSEQTASRGTD